MAKQMSKQKKFILLGGIIVVVLCLLSVLVIFGPRFGLGEESNYWAVYLNTGELYFGRLVRFSHYTIQEPYLLRITEDKDNPIVIQPFREVFWGPSKKLKFNPDNVVWITNLAPTSPVISYIESQANLGARPTVPSTVPPAAPSTLSPEATSTQE